MALPDSALTTLSRVKDELNISGSGEDTKIERMIQEASSKFRSLTNRQFHNVTGHTEKVEGTGSRVLLVGEHLPIDTINSIKFDEGDSTRTIDSSNYEIQNASQGKIRKRNGFWIDTEVTVQSIKRRGTGEKLPLYIVDYDGGYTTPNQSGTRDLPHEIERAVIQKAVQLYREQGKNPNIIQERALSVGITYGSPEGTNNQSRFEKIASRYRHFSF